MGCQVRRDVWGLIKPCRRLTAKITPEPTPGLWDRPGAVPAGDLGDLQIPTLLWGLGLPGSVPAVPARAVTWLRAHRGESALNIQHGQLQGCPEPGICQEMDAFPPPFQNSDQCAVLSLEPEAALT